MSSVPLRPKRVLVTGILIFLVTISGILYLTRETGFWGFYSLEGTEMHPTIRKGDYVLTRRFAGDVRSLKVGQIVVYSPPETIFPGQSRLSIGRISALPGDTVAIRNGTIWVNGRQHIVSGSPSKAPMMDTSLWVSFPLVVPPHLVFILGDNPATFSTASIWAPSRAPASGNW